MEPGRALIKNFSIPRRYSTAIVAVFSLALYAGAMKNGFVYDDLYLVLENPWIRDPRRIPDIFTQSIWSFKSSAPQNFYRPVLHLVYMADFHLFGLEPWGYHLTKLAFHAGSSALVLLIASSLIDNSWADEAGGGAGMEAGMEINRGRAYIPLAAALLFAAHPIHTDAVLNGITEVTFAFFYLLSFYLYIKGGKGAKRASVVFFFLAALSKETALTLPLMLLAYDYSYKKDLNLNKEGIYRLIKRYLPYLAAALVYLAMRLYALGALVPSKGHAGLGIYGNVINALTLFSEYLGKLLLPVNLNAAYVFDPVKGLFETRGIAAVAATALFGAVLYLLRNRRGAPWLSLLWVLIPLLPALYLPALGLHAFAERYLYLPSVGFVILLSVLILKPRYGSRALALAATALLVITCFYSAVTAWRVPVWHDELSLWTDTAEKTPDSFVVLNYLGLALYNHGRVVEAVAEYKKAIRLKPDYPDAHNNLGVAYHTSGRTFDAIDEYRLALGAKPDYVITLNNLGAAYYKVGMVDEAVSQYRLAIRIDPLHAGPHNNLGAALEKLGLLDEAGESYARALRLRPDFPEARSNLENLILRKETGPSGR